MSLKKRIFSCLIAACMLVCMFPVAYASDATYEVVGEYILFAPPIGVKSQITYVLREATTKEVVKNAVLTTSGSVPTGVSIVDNKIVLDGDTVQAGSFTVVLTDENATITASKDITIKEYRYFEDFEDQTSGSDAVFYLDKLDGTGKLNGEFISHTNSNSGGQGAIGSEAGNNFLKSPQGLYNWNVDLWYGNSNVSVASIYNKLKNITLSLKVKNPNNRLVLDKTGSVENIYVHKDGYIGKGINETSITNKVNVQIPKDEWIEIRITMDFNNNTYDVWADDTLIYDDMAWNAKYKYFWYFYGFIPADDIAIYSGEKVTEDSIIVDGNAYTDDALKADGTHVVKAIRNGVYEDGNEPTIVIAEYSEGGLEKLNVQKLEADIQGEYTLAARLTDVAQGHTVKVFLWDWDTNEITPILASQEID